MPRKGQRRGGRLSTIVALSHALGVPISTLAITPEEDQSLQPAKTVVLARIVRKLEALPLEQLKVCEDYLDYLLAKSPEVK